MIFLYYLIKWISIVNFSNVLKLQQSLKVMYLHGTLRFCAEILILERVSLSLINVVHTTPWHIGTSFVKMNSMGTKAVHKHVYTYLYIWTQSVYFLEQNGIKIQLYTKEEFMPSNQIPLPRKGTNAGS